MKFRPYCDGDAEELKPRLGDEFTHLNLDRLIEVSLAWSVEHDGKVFCVMGMVVPWEGLGEIWALVSNDARGHGRPFIRGIKVLIDGYAKERNLRRIDCHVHIDKMDYRHFVELLGFTPEYVKEQAAPDGGDLIGYVKWGPGKCLSNGYGNQSLSPSEEAAQPRRPSTTGNSGSSTEPGSMTPGNGAIRT